MRRLLPLALIATLAAGCSSTKAAPNTSLTVSPQQSSAATSSPTPTPSETVLTSQQIEYLKALGNKPDTNGTITFDPSLLQEGRAACGQDDESEDDYSSYDSSGPPTLDAIIEGDLDDDEDYRAAVKHLCPKYLPVLQKAKGGFSDGTYEVGKDIKSGTYRTTPGRVTDCYWERSTGGGTTIANDFVKNAPRGVTVTLRRGEGFTSEGCGNWMKA